MAHDGTFTRSWTIIGLAALAGGGLALAATPSRPLLATVWIVLGLVNLWGAWRHRALSRGGRPPR